MSSEEIVDLMFLVKTYPQPSSKYQTLVCSAGLTEDGRWFRLYPLKFEQFIGDSKLNKFDIIRLRLEKNLSDQRKESYKVIEVVETLEKGPSISWERRDNWIKKGMRSRSIEDLDIEYRRDFTSMGIIKPQKIMDLVSMEPVSEKDIIISRDVQLTLFGERVFSIDEIDNTFRYIFSCDGKCHHEIMCEDWELLQAYRSYSSRYDGPEITWRKLRERFFDLLVKERDLHFIVGTHSRFPTWMIIGLYYPPMEMERSKNLTLDRF